MTGTRVTVHRIDADPADVVEGPALERLMAHDPSVDVRLWRTILGFLPSDRLRTHLAVNQAAWPSSSELLNAVAECPATSALLEALPADGWIDTERQWREAEAADQARADDGSPTVFVWRRPLVRLGMHVAVSSDAPLPHDAADRMAALFGPVLTLQTVDHGITFVTAGTPQDVEARIAGAMAPD